MTDQAEAVNIEFEIAAVELKPDDVIVIRITDPNYRPTIAAVEEMRKRVRAAIGDHEVIILAYGLELEIVKPRPASDA